MYFQFSLRNYFKKNSIFRNLWAFFKPISKNKNIEIELLKTNDHWFKIELNANFTGQDHAGVSFEISLASYCLTLNIYDSRHWDYENNCWEN